MKRKCLPSKPNIICLGETGCPSNPMADPAGLHRGFAACPIAASGSPVRRQGTVPDDRGASKSPLGQAALREVLLGQASIQNPTPVTFSASQ